MKDYNITNITKNKNKNTRLIIIIAIVITIIIKILIIIVIIITTTTKSNKGLIKETTRASFIKRQKCGNAFTYSRAHPGARTNLDTRARFYSRAYV